MGSESPYVEGLIMAKNVAVSAEKNVSVFDDLVEFMDADSGKGVSQSADDNIVPLIYVLQALSPQVSKRNPEYVEGAEPGDLLKKNSIHSPLVKGEEGTIFQPCYFEKLWLEWRPNRGGFAGMHQQRPSDAVEVEEIVEGKPRRMWKRSNGNQVVETRQHIGYADGEPYVIPLASSGHTVSRTWMQMMNQMFIPGTSKIAPSFAKKYKLTTVEKSNEKGTWFVLKVEDAGWVNKEEYVRGKGLHEAFARGEKKAAAMEEHQSSDDSVPF